MVGMVLGYGTASSEQLLNYPSMNSHVQDEMAKLNGRRISENEGNAAM